MAFKNLKYFRDFSASENAKAGLPRYIAVEGVIGVGKTSLTRLLANRWHAEICLEGFEENPFLTGGFYKNTSELAFNTEVFFLLSRFRQQRQLPRHEKTLITDYVFDKNLVFAKMNLSEDDFSIFQSVYEKFEQNIRVPDLVVLLQADLETVMRRIYFRDREFERSISPDYIENLLSSYYRYFSSYTKAPVITVQTSGLDFVNDIEDFQKVCTLIESRLNGEIQLSLDPKTIVREKESHAPIV
jgi:deoxyguanosine kinase